MSTKKKKKRYKLLHHGTILQNLTKVMLHYFKKSSSSSFNALITSKHCKVVKKNFGSTEAAVRRCSSKQLFLKFRKFHRKTPVLETFRLATSQKVFIADVCSSIHL